MSGISLADQLKKLSSAPQPKTLDPESAYTSLDSLSLPKKDDPNEGKEHYLDVGPSRLRMQLDDQEGSGGTLRGVKYQGEKVGRRKIFDDDDDDEEDGGMNFGEVEDSEADDDEDEDEGEDDDGEEEEDEDDDDEEEDEDEDEDEDEEDEDQEEVQPKPKSSNKTLDPMASLRDSRAKDIEKGIAIRRQKALFESLLTLRITLQKALSSSTSLPKSIDAYPSDPEGEIASKKAEILKSLSDLNERLFTLREHLLLPGAEKSVGDKRKRDDYDEEEYWKQSAVRSLTLSDSNHDQIVPILNKWSSKIQAASLQLGSKQAGGSKFLQSVKNGSGGVVEAIEAGLASKRDSEKTLMESEESAYRSLLREVIESRSGSGPAADLTHLRKEKKKKREAERGGSKGRKLRYTVHEKAQNFVVPIPLSNGWHEEQVDELFSSLFGGVGMSGGGAVAEKRVEVDIGQVDGEGLSGLGGLRVF
ncbi:uncharacterized protein L199_004850 [Kwoniella botswanensis]|uniref:uncharacterized protein n=1 Tax=Kwoniella botswanensis TaxID=1268659 RepID=UPI00315DBD4E